MTQKLQELDEYRRTLDSFRKLYEDDGTISQDDQDYLKALSGKVEKLLLEDDENAPMSAFGGGGVSAVPKKTTQKQPAPKAKATPAPEYKKTGLADFMPAFNNPTAGLRLWNFSDGSEAPDANQQPRSSRNSLNPWKSHKNTMRSSVTRAASDSIVLVV